MDWCQNIDITSRLPSISVKFWQRNIGVHPFLIGRKFGEILELLVHAYFSAYEESFQS